MKFIIWLSILLVCSRCSLRKQYYSSKEIYLRKCYKKDAEVFFEFRPTTESIYFASGVDVNYDYDSTTVRMAFIRASNDGIKYEPDIKSEMISEGDSSVYWRILLPGSVNRIIVAPPDSLFVENLNK